MTATVTVLPCDNDFEPTGESPGWGHAVIVGVFVDEATRITVTRHTSVTNGARYTDIALRPTDPGTADVDLRIADGPLREMLRKLTAAFQAEAG